MLDYVTYQNPEGKHVDSIVFLLHGLGSNKEDLISLAPYFARACPNTVFVSPDAPQPCDMGPFGFQWFSLQNRDPHAMLQGIQESFPVLKQFIEDVVAKYQVKKERVILLGFSQGTMMSLYTAPRLDEKIGGVVGYSGALLGGAELSDSGFKKPPVLLIHGNRDDVVAYSALANAEEFLQKAGFDIKTVTCPNLGHSIDEKGIVAGIEFVAERLK